MSKDYCTILIGKGDSDFKTAMLLMKADPSLHETAGFHIQQAIEKYLKAYLISQHIEPPRSHNLFYLLNLCIDLNQSYSMFVDPMLSTINDFAVTFRYDVMPESDTLDLEHALHFTTRIRDLVLGLIPSA